MLLEQELIVRQTGQADSFDQNFMMFHSFGWRSKLKPLFLEHTASLEHQRAGGFTSPLSFIFLGLDVPVVAGTS